MENNKNHLSEELKEILRSGSGKCVILHDEKPAYVVMTWKEYKEIEKHVEEFKRLWEKIDIKELPL